MVLFMWQTGKNMRFTVTVKLLPALCALLAAAVSADIREEFLPQTHTAREITTQLDRLENGFRDQPSSESLAELDRIRNALKHIAAAYPEDAHRLETRADLIEMAIHFYGDNKSAAARAAERVFEKDPAATLSGQIGTMELARWFEEIRERFVGFLSVFTRPAGSRVYLNDRRFGTTPLEAAYTPLGDHEIRLEKDGYATWVGRVRVTAGETAVVNTRLSRNSGSLILLISPAETRIKIDSMTTPIVTRPAHPSLYPFLLNLGLWPGTFSQPLMVDSVKPGRRMIRFESNCHKPKQFRLEVSIGEFLVPPIILERSESRLNIRSTPVDQAVFIDGEYGGRTPLINHRICPGSHYISVQFEDGSRWSRHIVMADEETRDFDAYPRPSILFLGCASENTGLAIEATPRIENWINQSGGFNLIDRSVGAKYRYRPSVAGILETAGQPDFSSSDPDWLNRLSTVTASVMETGAVLVAFARIEPPGSRRDGTLFFIRTDSRRPDTLRIHAGLPGEKAPDTMIRFLDDLPDMHRLRSGLRVTTVGETVLISEIIPGGPAEMSPLQAGDRLLEMHGSPVNHRRDFEAILRNTASPEPMLVKAKRESASIETTITMRRQPIMLPINDPSIPYNLILSKLEYILRAGDGKHGEILNAVWNLEKAESVSQLMSLLALKPERQR